MNNDHINKNMIINNDYLFSAIFSLFTAKATGRERGFTIVFFYKHFLLKFEALEVRVNISLYDTCSRA